MIHLDHQLLYQDRRLVDGANTHHLKGLIFHYEAVSLHNAGLAQIKKLVTSVGTALIYIPTPPGGIGRQIDGVARVLRELGRRDQDQKVKRGDVVDGSHS